MSSSLYDIALKASREALEAKRVDDQPMLFIDPSDTIEEQAFFDPKTAKRQRHTNAADALLKGELAADKEATYNVVDEEGNVQGIRGTDLNLALQRGYRLETTKEARIRTYVKDNEGLVGSLKVGGGQFVDEALFGIPEQVGLIGGREGSEDREQWDALKQAHPTANVIGGVAGFGASLAVGGPLFKAATKAGQVAEGAIKGGTLARDVARGALKYGTEGLVASSPHVVTEAALGDPSEAAESALFGLGIGATLGMGARLAGRAVGALKPAVKVTTGLDLDKPLTQGLKDMSDHQASRGLLYGTDKKAIQQMDDVAKRFGADGADDVGRWVKDKDLLRNTAEDFDDYLGRIAAKKQDAGERIGAKYAEIDDALKKSNQGALPTLDGITRRIDDEVIKGLDRKAGFGGVGKKVKNYVDEFKSATQHVIDDRGGLTNNIGFKELHQQRMALDDLIYREGQIGITDKADKELKRIRDILTDELDRVGSMASPTFKREIKELNREFAYSKVVQDVVKRSSESQNARRNLSLSDYITGNNLALAGAGSMIGGLTSNDPTGYAIGAGVGFAGQRLSMLAHKYFREEGNNIVARYTNQLGLAIAHAAKQEGDDLISRIPGMLRTGKEYSTRVRQAAPMVIFRQFGTAARSEEDAVREIGDHLAQLSSDPKALDGTVASSVKTLSDGAPSVATAVAPAAARAVSYLNKVVPRDPNPVQPFKTSTWKPSRQEVRQFSRRLEVVNDPFVVVKRLGDGTLKREHVEALDEVYPSYAARIRASVSEAGVGPGARKMTQAKRERLDILFKESTKKTDVLMTQQALGGTLNLNSQFGSQQPPNKSIKFRGSLPGSLGDKGEGLTQSQRTEFDA